MLAKPNVYSFSVADRRLLKRTNFALKGSKSSGLAPLTECLPCVILFLRHFSFYLCNSKQLFNPHEAQLLICRNEVLIIPSSPHHAKVRTRYNEKALAQWLASSSFSINVC